MSMPMHWQRSGCTPKFALQQAPPPQFTWTPQMGFVRRGKSIFLWYGYLFF
jgi:hypothetical protein